jgi:sirohydrochlorin ferrochelatase
MKSLLLVAHGSRRAASNEEVRELASRLEVHTKGSCGWVACAFLELAEPSIPDGLRQAIHAGATEVTVLPYFLSAGRHVVKDIPNEVDVVRAEYPEVKITLASYLGASAGIVELLVDLAGQH